MPYDVLFPNYSIPICVRCGVPLSDHIYNSRGERWCNRYSRTASTWEETMLNLPDLDDPIIRDENGRLVRCGDLAKRYRRECAHRHA